MYFCEFTKVALLAAISYVGEIFMPLKRKSECSINGIQATRKILVMKFIMLSLYITED